MTDALRAAIEEMTRTLEQKLKEAADLKRTINILARQMGEEPVYPETDEEITRRPASAMKLRPDHFFGKPPTTAAREYLEIRNEPATAEEILEALARGGFDFDAQNWKDEKYRLKNLAISLGKNSAIFTRLPSGPFGLAKWYPGHVRRATGAQAKSGGADTEGGNEKEEDLKNGDK
jgi:hypothetical protein